MFYAWFLKVATVRTSKTRQEHNVQGHSRSSERYAFELYTFLVSCVNAQTYRTYGMPFEGTVVGAERVGRIDVLRPHSSGLSSS